MAYGYPYQMQQPVMPSYFNTNYAPPMPQMQQPQTQNQMQTPAANVTWIYVNGWDGARNQIVQPGQTAWMMDNNDPVIYIKAVDNMGSATLRAFKLTEIDQQSTANQTPAEGQKYAMAADMTMANERIGRLESALNGLMNELGGARNESAGANNG